MRSHLAPAALFAAILTLSACSEEHDKAAKPEPIRPVLSVVVEPQAADSASFAGTIESRYTADLSFRLLGRVTSRPVETGDQVTVPSFTVSSDVGWPAGG